MENNLPILSISHLGMRFGEKQVLTDINFDVYKGQIIGYIGPNGAGKSTTVKIMLGIIEGYSGCVQILGQDIKEHIDYKRKIGYVPESADIYDNLSAKEYLSFIGQLYGLTEHEVEHKAKRLIKLFGLETVYLSRLSSYSKGMKQKVLLIASLLHNPEILFLDEPLSGLDASSVLIVKELMSELAKQGKTIFYSSHIMDVVEKISSRIILISGGKVIADGSFDELKNNAHEESLEIIFNQLTGFHQHKEIVQEILTVIKEGE